MQYRNLLVALLFNLAACADGKTGPTGPPGSGGALPPGYLNVLDFGARADLSSFDNTASFQRALDSAGRAGGGTVWVPVGRFFFAGDISIGANVALAGAGVGPYDPGPDPAQTTVAPTLLPTSTTGSAFITILGQNSALQDVLIRYPNQVRPDAPGVDVTGPTVYPPTVRVLAPAKIFRCNLTNSYVGIEVLIGRVYLENLHLGSFKNDIIIDNAEDVVHLSHIMVSVFGWDLGVSIPSPIDTWVMNNGVALTSYRADALVIDDFFAFIRHTGIAFLDSPQGYGTTYGVGSNIDLDNMQYGVIAKSLTFVGFQFSNLAIGSAVDGVNMIWLPAGGQHTPSVVVEGGATWGPVPGYWAQTLKVDAGTLLVRDIVGLSPIGWLPALGLVAPPLPASGVAYVSNMPAIAEVSISSGSVQSVLIDGRPTGLTSGMFQLSPGASITVTYTSAPTWSWYLQ